MKKENLECYCNCHFGGKVSHYRHERGRMVPRHKNMCHCEDPDSSLYIEEEIRKELFGDLK